MDIKICDVCNMPIKNIVKTEKNVDTLIYNDEDYYHKRINELMKLMESTLYGIQSKENKNVETKQQFNTTLELCDNCMKDFIKYCNEWLKFRRKKFIDNSLNKIGQ